MGFMFPRDAERLAKRLKRILQEQLAERTRLGHCQAAVAEGFDFDGFGQMVRALPARAAWNREWCVNRLVDEGHVEHEPNAAEAVRRLEVELGHVIAGRPERTGVADGRAAGWMQAGGDRA